MFMPNTSWVEVGQGIERADEFEGIGPLEISTEGGDVEVPIGTIGTIHSSDGHHVNIEISDGFIFNMLLGDFVSYFKPIGKNETVHEKAPMIQERHPDFTLEGVRESVRWEREQGYVGDIDITDLRYLGYWYRVKGDGWADPTDYIDESWDAKERELVARYLESDERMVLAHWRGFSWCRCGCTGGTGVPGTQCMTDGKYVWPEGFVHYVRVHSVKPPAEFIEEVRRMGGNL
jgi:hypothetical protein